MTPFISGFPFLPSESGLLTNQLEVVRKIGRDLCMGEFGVGCLKFYSLI